MSNGTNIIAQNKALRDALSALSIVLRRKHERERQTIADYRANLAKFLTDTNDASLSGLRDALWTTTVEITESIASSMVYQNASAQIAWVAADYSPTAPGMEVLFTATRLIHNMETAYSKSTSSSGPRDIAYIHNESISNAVDSVLRQLDTIGRDFGLVPG